MDFQAQSVAGAMEKALHATVAFAGLVAFLIEKLPHRLVHFNAANIGLHLFEGDLLSARDGLIELAHRFVSAPFDNRPRDVAEVAGFLRARENVDDDGFVRPQGAMPLLVRIAGLSPTGDDGVGRQTASLNNGDIDDRAQFFGSQRDVVIHQPSSLADPGVFEGLNAFGEPDLGHHQGGADLFHFVGRLEFPFGEKVPFTDLDLDFQPAEFARQPVGKAVWNEHFSEPFFLQNFPDDGGETGRLDSVTLELIDVMRPGEHAAMARLFAGAVDLQVVHHDVALAPDAKVNEGIGDEHPHGVEHVGVMLAVGHHQ